MKALVFQNGELRLETDRPAPRPAPGEALVRVTLAGICATDLEIVKGYMDYAGILGHEFTGVVEGPAGSPWMGRRVAGEINAGCGHCGYCAGGLERHCPERNVLGIAGRDGAFAEYLVLPEANLHELPDGVADAEAVFVEPLAAAFEIVQQVDIRAEDTICVLGDGRLGLLVAQVLALYTDSVLAVGRHPEKLAILEKLGLPTALAGRSGAGAAGGEDEAAATRPPGAVDRDSLAISHKFDIVIDCTGSATGLTAALDLVRPRGTIVLKTTIAGTAGDETDAGETTGDELRANLNRLVIDEITLLGSRCGPFRPAIDALAAGRIDVTRLISATFPLDKGIEAMRFAAQKGVLKVLLSATVSDADVPAKAGATPAS